MMALKLLWRSWRGGQLGLIFGSLVMAVVVVTSVALLADRVERALVKESSNFLAADAQVRSSREMPSQWLAEAHDRGVMTAEMALFASMVYSGDYNHLASVKAVQDNYPLRGVLTLSETPFATKPEQFQQVDHGPQPGEAWVDSRLLPLLNMNLGDRLDVGEVSLRATRVIVEEPDRGGSFSLFGARVLMNWEDLAASGVIQPGSRVNYRLLLAAGDDDLADYLSWLEPQLAVHDRLLSPDEAQAGLTDTLAQGRRFLLLAGSLGVVLAGIALALASRHFAVGQTATVALLKSWGVSARRVRALYWQQTLWLGLAGSLLGLALGWVIHEVLIVLVRELLPVNLPAPGWRPWLTGLATGLLCLLGFALPALWHLPALSPLVVLRRDMPVQLVGAMRRLLIGVVVVAAMLLWYSQSLAMTLAVLGGLALTAATVMGPGWLLLRLLRHLGNRAGSVWRLALGNLWRRRVQSLVLLAGFASAMAILMTLVMIRTSLLEEWRWQLAEDAPNHFLVNVAPHELAGVEKLLADNQLQSVGWYAMVRGRITLIDGQPPSEELVDSNEALRRELNLSWSSQLPEGNVVEWGAWWDQLGDFSGRYGENVAPVSIEQDLAEEIGVTLGSRLTFNVGGLTFEGLVTSIRSLNWDTMTPNFYILFPEGYLEKFPRIFMTSLYLPQDQKPFVNELLREYPTVLVIELDMVIDRIRTMVSQVTHGLELMTLLILGCGVLVMLSAVKLSMGERLQESAILRTLGSTGRRILTVQSLEFGALGALSGLLAASGAELALFLLQRRMFEAPFELHWALWACGPLLGALLVGALGVLYTRQSVTRPPLQVLSGL
ncbi:ABC transporter permease [Porticoccus sp.]